MNAKTCKQCGELKPINQFRQYYGGRKGTYTTCRQCERINSRKKYLSGKSNLSEAEMIELDKIIQLYEYQAKLGLQPPRSGGRSKALGDDLDDMLQKYTAMAAPVEPMLDNFADAPGELLKWLTVPLDREPDYYLDVVYDKLRDNYRPVIRVDSATMMPVYDDKYKGILDRILERFNSYEDTYYEED